LPRAARVAPQPAARAIDPPIVSYRSEGIDVK